jgi:hypothetical protein
MWGSWKLEAWILNLPCSFFPDMSVIKLIVLLYFCTSVSLFPVKKQTMRYEAAMYSYTEENVQNNCYSVPEEAETFVLILLHYLFQHFNFQTSMMSK